MPRALSLDLRERVIAAIAAGSSCRRAAERFGVGPSTAIRWQARFRTEGEVAAKPMGGDQSSSRIEAYAAAILQASAAQPQAYLRELRDSLREQGIHTSTSGLHRFFARHGITRKKGAVHAAEQDRPDVMKAREGWAEGQLDLGPDRVVFLDETAAATNMARRHGRSPRGERCLIAVPHGHYKTTTVTAALRASGPFAMTSWTGPPMAPGSGPTWALCSCRRLNPATRW